MKKQIEKIDEALLKVSGWIEKTINWEFRNNKLILQLLHKKERLLEKTKKKLVALNLDNLLNWEEVQKHIIN